MNLWLLKQPILPLQHVAFEEMLKTELEQICGASCKVAQGGVHFTTTQKGMYQALLHSRLASHFTAVSYHKIFSDLDLYASVVGYNWAGTFRSSWYIFHDFNGTKPGNSYKILQFGAMRERDGIVDYFERKRFERPAVDKIAPDVRIHVYLNRDDLVISLDLSGEALHMRGYRSDTGKAPLRKTLAAAIVLRSGQATRYAIGWSDVWFRHVTDWGGSNAGKYCPADSA